MGVPINKQELRKAILTNYDKLRSELLIIDPKLSTEYCLEGHARGTLMSINNLLAYLVGWGQLVLKWIDTKDRNEKVDFPETGYKWNELGKLAQKFYKDYKDDSFMVLQEKLSAIVSQILDVIECRSNAELYEVPWYEKWTMGRMIQFNTSSPYNNARGRLRKWNKNDQKASRSKDF